MQIKCLKDGRVLLQGAFQNYKKALESIQDIKQDLSFADFRKANLSNITMDGLKSPGSCFWGASLKNSNLCGAVLSKCDFRLADLTSCCLAEADCHGSDFRGALFKNAIMTGADLSHCDFSCPTIFEVDLYDVKSLQGSMFHHRGEIKCPMTQTPVVIKGFCSPVVYLDHHIIFEGRVFDIAHPPASLTELTNTVTTMTRYIKGRVYD